MLGSSPLPKHSSPQGKVAKKEKWIRKADPQYKKTSRMGASGTPKLDES